MTYHEASKTSQTEARATSDWTPTLARIEQLEAEVERLRAENAEHLLRADSLRAELARCQAENERMEAAVQAVRDLPTYYVYAGGDAEGAAFLDRYAVLAALDGEAE